MLSSANILFIKDAIQTSTEQLGVVISPLNTLFNQFFPRENKVLWLFFNLYLLQCSSGLKHPLHQSLQGAWCRKNSLNEVLSVPFEWLPAVAELCNGTVLVPGTGVREQAGGEGLSFLVLCLGSGLAASLEHQLGLECSGSGGKGPEKLKLSHVAITGIWENLSYEICFKATALGPILSFQQTQSMFISWVLGLLKCSVGGGNLALNQQDTREFFFSAPGSDFYPFIFSPSCSAVWFY